MSSLPLPARIHSGGTPSSSLARRRKAPAIGSGYFCRPRCNASLTADGHRGRRRVGVLVGVQLDEPVALRLFAGHVAGHGADVGAEVAEHGCSKGIPQILKLNFRVAKEVVYCTKANTRFESTIFMLPLARLYRPRAETQWGDKAIRPLFMVAVADGVGKPLLPPSCRGRSGRYNH